MEQNWSEEEKAFLLHTYGEEYGPDAGPWNTSVESKYLEYRITEFFERFDENSGCAIRAPKFCGAALNK